MGVSKKGGDSDTEGMNSEPVQVYRVERVDDIPVLLATLNKLKVAEILDRHYPSGHRWKGELTFGEVTCVWLAFLTSQGDHRLCRLAFSWDGQALLARTHS